KRSGRGRAVGLPRLPGFGRRPEILQVFRQVLLDLLDEGEDIWLVAELLAQLRDERASGKERDVPIERQVALLGPLLSLSALAPERADLRLDLPAPLLEFRECLRWQLLERLWRHRLAVLQRNAGDAGRRHLQRELAFLRKGAQVRDQLGAPRTH